MSNKPIRVMLPVAKDVMLASVSDYAYRVSWHIPVVDERDPGSPPPALGRAVREKLGVQNVRAEGQHEGCEDGEGVASLLDRDRLCKAEKVLASCGNSS